MAVLEATDAQRRYRKVYDDALPKPKTAFATAKTFLKKMLDENGGRLQVRALNKAARAEGIVIANLNKARQALGCGTVQEGIEWYCLAPELKPAATIVAESFNDLSRTHEKCEDQFNVSMEERRRLGIRDDEQVCWIPDPRWWRNKAPGQSPDMWQRRNSGGRIITENGEYIPNGDDLIMAVRPMEEVEKLRERERIECEAAERINVANEAGFKRPDDFDASDKQQFEMIKQMNHEQFVRSGWVGPASPSSGLSLEQYKQYRGLSEADIEREAIGFALGHHVAQDLSDEQIMALGNPVPERGGRSGQPRSNDGKFYSLPPTIRPRNLAQPQKAAE